MGLRLKSQLIALCLSLMLITLGALTYFHLSLSSEDNLARADLTGRRVAEGIASGILAEVRSSGISLRDLSRAHHFQKFMQNLDQNADLLQYDVFAVDGMRLLTSGKGGPDDALTFQQALFWLQTHRETYVEIWGHSEGRAQPLLTIPPFYRGQVVHHSYHSVFDNRGNLEGVLHLAVLLPKASFRISLIITGYLTIAAIFLISSLISIYLWAEFALNRPLRGLGESLQQLRSLHPSGNRPDALPQPNELSEAARALNHVTLDLVKYQQELQEQARRLEQANQQYRQLNEELEQKVAEKTLQMREFFSLVTHDLRIPLAAVSGYTELLANPRSGQLAEKQQRFLQHIQVANTHAQELVRNLLEAMKYEFGHPALSCESFDLRTLVQEVQSQLAIENKPITVVAEDGEDFSVFADRNRMQRVLTNLVSNALHHAGSAQVEIHQFRETVHVCVRDDGPGIPPEEIPHLFEKFKRPTGGSEKAPASSGLGLGLYIVQRVLSDHGRVIEVKSEPGRGTEFSFELPRRQEDKP